MAILRFSVRRTVRGVDSPGLTYLNAAECLPVKRLPACTMQRLFGFCNNTSIVSDNSELSSTIFHHKVWPAHPEVSKQAYPPPPYPSPQAGSLTFEQRLFSGGMPIAATQRYSHRSRPLGETRFVDRFFFKLYAAIRACIGALPSGSLFRMSLV